MYTSVKNRVFWHDMRRAGMVIGIGKVCAVHQRPCVVVPAYLPTVDVLDHDVVWWLTKFFCRIVTASVALLHTFFLNRKQLLWLNRKQKLHNFIFSLEFEGRVLRGLNFAVLKTNKQKKLFFSFVKSTVLFQGPHRGHWTGRSYIGCYTYVWRYDVIFFF